MCDFVDCDCNGKADINSGQCDACGHLELWHKKPIPESAAEEEDYMSSDWLAKLAETEKQTLAAKGVKRRRDTSAAEQLQPRAAQPKATMAERMVQAREEGLNTAISKDNIGHRLLSKMGYKDGEGLGKNKEGITAPIDIHIKSSKTGIGKEKMLSREDKIQDKHAKAAHAKVEEEKRKQHFRDSKTQQLSEAVLRADVAGARSVCESLDAAVGVDDNPLWFKPPPKPKPNEEEEAGGGFGRRRLTYPSEEEEPVQYEQTPTDDSEDVSSSSSSAGTGADQWATTLHHLLRYMRDRHVYCYYCAIRFSNEADLNKNCPGVTKQDHDD